jgi:type II secretory pathway pseudopilin PulG
MSIAESTAPPPGRRARAGFTIVELLVYVVLAVAVLGAVYGAMITQSRSYGKQRELLDARESLRSGGALLAWELRHASVAGSKVVAIGSDSITVRSMQGLGTVCAKHPTNLPRYALWRTSGDIQATADDSAIFYRPETGVWKAVRVTQVGTPAALGVSTCAWPGGRAPDIAIEVNVSIAADTAGIVVGSGYRAFRETLYSEYLDGGRYWLGRKTPPTAGTWDKLTGPLLAPDAAAGGLNFTFFDSGNNVTTIPANVARVGLVLRGESLKRAGVSAGVTGFQVDSVVNVVMLRR